MSQIILTIGEQSGYFIVVIKNTIQTSVLEQNYNLKSQKENNKEHGWGLKSVREIVEKHEGIIDIYEKNDMFIVSIKLMKRDFPDVDD